ncbi:MAG: hypothetical protein RLZZ366_1028 [Pseudomonadota bacterium]
MPLNLTKVAYGMTSLAELQAIVARRAVDGSVRMTTRYRPKRAAEMDGGSLFWIIKHQLIARANLIGFEDAEGGRTDIVLEAIVRPVHPIPKRAHQGWRYLAEEDAPADLDAGMLEADIPPALMAELVSAGLA